LFLKVPPTAWMQVRSEAGSTSVLAK
jgi:hypothetical protein